MISTNLLGKAKSLPRSPGSYQFRDSTGAIIYVGKAKNLQSRVTSYFVTNFDPQSKTYALVHRINDITFIEAASELEAIILEAELIKKHRPKYNIDLKDDKSYLYIVIRTEENVPKIIAVRQTNLAKHDVVFGPYPDGTSAKYILKVLRKLFPFRDCSANKYKRYEKLGKPCLYGYIGLCPGPCVYKSSDDRKVYLQNIASIKKLLAGKSETLLTQLTKAMTVHSKAGEFEEAAYYRDLIARFNYMRQEFRMPGEYIDNPHLKEDLNLEAVQSVENILPGVVGLPHRIECYDIANISGKEAVGAMVVAVDGDITKANYRKFKIRLEASPNDFGMLAEVLTRRLAHSIDWPLPDLIVVDGGKGQVSAVLDVVNSTGAKIPVIGLAKKFETVVYKSEDGLFTELHLAKDTPGLKLLIRLRDEAHRFAQAYHHQLRLKKIYT